jgi:tetratricopeptide (TPR) repeat protein
MSAASTLTIDQALGQAVEAHRAGRLQDAARLYRAILAVQPAHVEANHNLGVLTVRAGKAVEALVYFESALRAQPQHERLWLSYVEALAACGRIASARSALQQARSAGLGGEAIDGLEARLPREPSQAEARALLEAYQTRAYDELERVARDLAAAYPNSALAWKALGVALLSKDQAVEAVAPLTRSTELRPNDAEVYSFLADANRSLGELGQAEACLRKAIGIAPNEGGLSLKLGNLLMAMERFADAEGAYCQALALRPDDPAGHMNRGVALSNLGKFDEAETCFRRVLSLAPGDADAPYNLGNLFRDTDRLEASVAAYRAALAIKPDMARARNNLAGSLSELGRGHEAVDLYRLALARNPDDTGAHWNKGLQELSLGHFADGWREYEWRWRHQPPPPGRPLSRPLWLGETPIDGKTIAVHWEQGLGDTIQFCRYLPLLEARGARVLFAGQEVLRNLMKGLPGSIELVDLADLVDGRFPFDCHVPLGSLPLAFKTDLASIPNAVPYLRAEPDRVRRWSDRLGRHGFRIGICWQGRLGNVDIGRSFPLASLSGIARLPGVRLICLHKGEGLAQLADLPDGMVVETLGADFDVGPDAFLDSAAVMTHCDLVISSDTAIAHLAGALGVATWLGLKSSPEWRWMVERDDSPWYPSMRLFRQTRRGDWRTVFDRMEVELRSRL